MNSEINTWVTIQTFSLPHEAHLSKNNLESEGIEVFLKDELTAQVHNFYSNAIGGVKLQVRPEDKLRAMQILGQNVYSMQVEAPSPIIGKLHSFANKFPILKKLEGDVKTFVGLVLLISFIVIGFTLLFLLFQL